MVSPYLLIHRWVSFPHLSTCYITQSNTPCIEEATIILPSKFTQRSVEKVYLGLIKTNNHIRMTCFGIQEKHEIPSIFAVLTFHLIEYLPKLCQLKKCNITIRGPCSSRISKILRSSRLNIF